MHVDRDLATLREALAPGYRVLRVLGRGGMATVYLAETEGLGAHSRVAVKVLRAELAASWGPDRFRREVEVTASLDHPSIVPVLASGRALGLPYYVMPYVSGESLRERIKRAGPLPVAEAVAIAVEVAEALEVAHGRGVVHRDIKPSNIFMSDGAALVADFGIARLVDAGDEERLTESGVVVGTPGYMSPEQASGSHDVDARSDLYSLACVLFEMLTGEPPFTGRTREAVVAKQLALPAPSATTLRPRVGAGLDRFLARALAKVPADRFQTAEEFKHALHGVGDPSEARRRWVPSTAIAGAAAVVVLGGAALTVGILGRGADTAAADTTVFALLPLRFQPGVEEDPVLNRFLEDALSRWTGATVANPFRLQEVLEGIDPSSLTASQAREAALTLGAGRYVQGEVSRVGDSVRVHAILADARGEGEALADWTVRLGNDQAGALRRLVDGLLLGLPPSEVDGEGASTPSLPARRAFLRGKAELSRWTLAGADSAFTEAVGHDASYPEAHLWIALVRAWRGEPEATWSVAARQASLGLGAAQGRAGGLARAIQAQAEGDLGAACPLWQELTRTDSLDHVAWYGHAVCLAADDAVLADPAAPTGFRFRTSYHAALGSYRRAFRLHPAILASFGDLAAERVGDLFKFTGAQRRLGRAPAPDTTRFQADPAWLGDTLAFVPVPLSAGSMRSATSAESWEEANIQLRLAFRSVAAAWAAHDRASPHARKALARALAMLGDASALDTLRGARPLAGDPRTRLGLMTAEVWMQLALSLPADTVGVRRARALADTVLALGDPEAALADEVAALAALTGRADRAAELSGVPGSPEVADVPAPVRSTAPVLLTLSALGGPVDRLRALETEVTARITDGLPPSARPQALLSWVVRPGTLAFPTYRFRSLESLGPQPDYLWNIQRAWAAGDTGEVRAGLAEVEEARRSVLPGNLTWDALAPEAALLLEMGEAARAADWLDPALRALPQSAPSQLAQPVRAASLVRALILRAGIAERSGRRAEAAAWARAVSILWGGADPFLQETVERMKSLAN